MIVAKTRDDIFKDVQSRLNGLGLQPMMNGVTESLIQGVVDILYAAEQDRVNADNETNPSLATGTTLEQIAQREFNLRRETGSNVVDSTFTNFHFYISGNLKAKDITTDSAGFTIPAHAFVRDAAGSLFMTTMPAIFDPNSNAAFCQIISVNPVQQEIPALSLNQHDVILTDIENISEASLGSNVLLCANNKALPSSTSTETDESLRLRMYQHANSLNQTNDTRLRSILTSIPGVLSVDFRRNKRGNGSVECILNTQQANPSDSIYSRAEALILQNIYGADNIFVVKPQYLPMKLTLKVVAEGTIENLSEVTSTISIGAADYVNNVVRQGGTFVLAEFTAAMRALVTGIQNVEIECIYVNNRRTVIKDQSAFYNQKFVVMSPSDIIVK